jgi:membrane protein
MTRMNERRTNDQGQGNVADAQDGADGSSNAVTRVWRGSAPGGKRWGTLRRACVEFGANELADRAAALTFFGVLSLFPALLVLVSLFGAAGASATQTILDNLKGVTPGAARTVILKAVAEIQSGRPAGYALAAAGLVWALCAAFAYVAAFVRSSRAVHDLPPGRPGREVVRTRPAAILVLTVIACAGALTVVFTGGIAEQAGQVLGIGETALTVWSIVKWPALVLLVAVMFALLRRASPNAPTYGFRWVTPGSLLALLLCVPPSTVFALYAANLTAFDKTYGALASMIIFLVWFWTMNVAMLLGLEFDAELARGRRVPVAAPAEVPYAEAAGPAGALEVSAAEHPPGEADS